MHIFFCFDTKSLGPVISMWPEGQRPTKVIAIFEVDELKTRLPIASGQDISGDDEFLCVVRCTLNPRTFECQTRKGLGRLFSPVPSLHLRVKSGPRKMSIQCKVTQHLMIESKQVAPHLQLWGRNSHAFFCKNLYRMALSI